MGKWLLEGEKWEVDRPFKDSVQVVRSRVESKGLNGGMGRDIDLLSCVMIGDEWVLDLLVTT